MYSVTVIPLAYSSSPTGSASLTKLAVEIPSGHESNAKPTNEQESSSSVLPSGAVDQARQNLLQSQEENSKKQLESLDLFFLYQSFKYQEAQNSGKRFDINKDIPALPETFPDREQLVFNLRIDKKVKHAKEVLRLIDEEVSSDTFHDDSLVASRYSYKVLDDVTEGSIRDFYRHLRSHKKQFMLDYCEAELEKLFKANPGFIVLAVEEGYFTGQYHLLGDCTKFQGLDHPNFYLQLIKAASKQNLLDKNGLELLKKIGFCDLPVGIVNNYIYAADAVASCYVAGVDRPDFSDLPIGNDRVNEDRSAPGVIYRALESYIEDSVFLSADEVTALLNYTRTNFGRTYAKDLEIDAYMQGYIEKRPEITQEDLVDLCEHTRLWSPNFLIKATKAGLIDDFDQLANRIQQFICSDSVAAVDLYVYMDALFEAIKQGKEIDLLKEFQQLTSSSSRLYFIDQVTAVDFRLTEKSLCELLESGLKHLKRGDISWFESVSVLLQLGMIKESQSFWGLMKAVPQSGLGENPMISTYVADLIAIAIDRGVVNYDRAYLSALKNESTLPVAVSLKMEQLKKNPKIVCNFDTKIQAEINKVFTELASANSQAREDQRIDLDEFINALSTSVINIFAVNPKIAKNIIDNVLYQRRNPQMTQDSLIYFAFLSAEEVEILADSTKKHKALFADNPQLLVDLAGYLNAYKNFGISLDKFRTIVTERDYSMASQLSKDLAIELIKVISAKENLNLDIDLDKVKANANFTKEWDLRYLGSLLSAANKWKPEQKVEYGLILKVKLEGNEAGLVSPAEYADHPLELYGDESTQSIAHGIRMQNLNLLQEAEAHGADLGVWTNAHNPAIMPPVYTLGKETQRKPIDILRDFKLCYGEFSKWLENEHLSEENEIYTRGFLPDSVYYDETKDFKPMDLAKERQYWQDVAETIEPWTRKKMDSKVFNAKDFKDFTYSFGTQLLFVKEYYAELMPEKELPEAFWDMDLIYQEMCDYNFDYQAETAKNYRVRFLDPKDIGHLLFTGNRANSCTAFGRNANAVFGFARHLGTKYLVIEDTSSTLENPMGNIKGYIRVFLGINKENEAVIYYDTIDGSAAAKHKELMRTYLDDFAAKLGLKVQERDGGLVDIIGGAPQGYFNHGGTMAGDLNPGPRQIDDEGALLEWQSSLRGTP